MENKSWLAVGGVLVAVVALAIVIKGFRSDESYPGGSAPGVATGSRAVTGSGTDAQEHSGARTSEEQSGAPGVAGSRHPDSDGLDNGSVSGADRGESAAAVVRKRLTSGNAHGIDAAMPAGRGVINPDGSIDADAKPGTDAAAQLRPQNAPHRNSAQADGSNPDTVAEPVPEVAYDSGPDKRFTTDQQVQVPDTGKISGQAGTMSFWVKPQWDAANQDDATFLQLGDSGMHIVKNVTYLRFEYTDNTGAEQGLGSNISDWNLNSDWQHVATTWENGQYALYINGKRVAFSTFANPPDFQQETKVYVGTYYPNGAPIAPGQEAQVNILNRGSSPAEIAKLYETTKPR